jgi:allantoin racemase
MSNGLSAERQNLSETCFVRAGLPSWDVSNLLVVGGSASPQNPAIGPTSYLREGAQDQLVCEASERLVSAGAEAVVVTGAAVAGIAHRLTPLVPVPIVDGIGCAVGQAEYLVRLGLRYGQPGRKLKTESDFSGVSSELVSRLTGR